MSLSPRLMLVLLVPIALCFAAFGLTSIRLRRQLMTAEAAREVHNHGATLQVTLDAYLREHRLDELAPLTRGLGRADRILSVLIFDPADRPLDASQLPPGDGAAFAPLARRARAARRGFGEMRQLEGRTVYAYAIPLGVGAGAPRGAAVILRDLDYVEANVRSLVREILLIGAAVVCVVALGIWLAMRSAVIEPLSALLRGVERVAAGDLAVAITTVRRRDEVGRLAAAFNGMTASLREAREALEAQSAANVALERRLQHAQRLALIGQLSANVAHQVGSPLNVILGRARYALKHGGQSERDARHFQEIIAGAENISRVIEGLLSQARRARGPAGPVDLGQLARATVRFLETECDRAGVVATVDAEPDVLVEGRRDELEQVVLNLCVNALQVQPAGGRLELGVRRARHDADDAAELTVADGGPGVPDEMRPRIFEPFFTTKPAGEGTGLGLAICDEIVRRHGGTVVVSSAPGGGALFRVTLPVRPVAGRAVLSDRRSP